jgi:nucleotide-binding universal stress UspA family protein
MIKRILIGLGGTPFTPTAIRYAVELAEVHEAELLGMTVIDRRRLSALTRASGRAQDALRESRRLEGTEKQQEQAIVDFESACTNAGLRYNVTRESGDPFEKMISQARYYDLMIFGLRSLFDYDVAGTKPSDVLTQLVSRGVRPILAVSQEYRPIRRVLMAYSGSMESAKAIRRFMQMQLWQELSFKAVTFEHPPEVASELLSEIAGYCRAYGHDIEVEYVADSAKQQLLQQATDWEADIVVVGNSIKHYWLKKLLGETAMHVISQSRVPLFLSQ